MKISCIVEGHGEVAAVPLLVRRIAQSVAVYPEVLPPMRVPASKLMREGEVERALLHVVETGHPAPVYSTELKTP